MQRVLVLHSDPIIAVGLQACLSGLHELQVDIGNPASPLTGWAVIVCDEPAARRLVAPVTAATVVFARTPRSSDIRRALQRGAMGYVVEASGPSEIAAAVQEAAARRHFLCPLSAREIATDFASDALTDRESTVLALLATGLGNKAIARELDIAIGTVKAHVRAILGKLKARSRTEAASIAMTRGFVPEDVRAAA
jgi:DNA-binding NarL/FixJ family response regulator